MEEPNLGKETSGYHPGIYKDEVLKNGYVGDPFVHYLKQGKPEGKWKVKVIEPKTVVDVNSIYGKVALHIHVHYKELLESAVALKWNSFNQIFLYHAIMRIQQNTYKSMEKNTS